ncbi:hypothetical protein VL04_18395 [Chromobacterium violaceum]|uniref:hypothetical protein n=1 Tax=Chromobacterium violaceum TaxID=536 RepID=UPI0006546485|nr:hypothetical protein [Chromobacterium violaceum]KMN48641.1 hypothetical protein VK93_14065 [Chromobacterium violaceum]KMN87736.1 hypothetical protein VL02_00060 [Chromobacterium violaceum]KMN88845.1 hypothetical protein VL04_18395 [Chromobacterium violaceum]KMO05339.1 hypothetical protein VL16_02045 [Chromobacterium violaceum]
MTSSNRRLSSLEDVLDEFFFSADKPSPEMVLRACEAHPEFREDILEFAALWSTHEEAPASDEPAYLDEISEESVSRLQSFVLDSLHKLDSKPSQDTDIEKAKNAIESLAGGALRRAATAAGLGGSTLLLQKILTKAIKDVPMRVLASLASHLNVTVNALQSTLADTVVVGRSYRASDKPNVPVLETWESAVRTLPVSDEEKDRLLALQSNEAPL